MGDELKICGDIPGLRKGDLPRASLHICNPCPRNWLSIYFLFGYYVCSFITLKDGLAAYSDDYFIPSLPFRVDGLEQFPPSWSCVSSLRAKDHDYSDIG